MRDRCSEAVTMHLEDGTWVIKDHKTGVVTQGETRLKALLMLVDALSAYNDTNIDLMEAAEDVFVMDEEQREFIEQMKEEED